jgi:hypothetical protein
LIGSGDHLFFQQLADFNGSAKSILPVKGLPAGFVNDGQALPAVVGKAPQGRVGVGNGLGSPQQVVCRRSP